MKQLTLLFLTFLLVNYGNSQTLKEYIAASGNKFDQGEWSESLAILNEALISYPDKISLLFSRGQVLHKLDRWEEAIADFTTGINNFYLEIEMPTEEQKKYVAEYGYYHRGIAKGKLNDYVGSILDYNLAIELNDKHINSYFNRGMMKLNLNQQGSACYDFSIAESLGDKEVGYYIRLYCGN
jgi:tetratricopeptide (TPR) repeat protein